MIITQRLVKFKMYAGDKFQIVDMHVAIVEKQCAAKDRIKNKRTCILSIIASFIDFKYITNFRKDNKNIHVITETKINNNNSDVALKASVVQTLNKYIDKINNKDINVIVPFNYIINSEHRVLKINANVKYGKIVYSIIPFNRYTNKEDDIYRSKLINDMLDLIKKEKP